MPFLTHEMTEVEGSVYAHELDVVTAFNVVYRTMDEWIAKAPGLWKLHALPDCFLLKAAAFSETENYALRANTPPAAVAYLMSASIGALAVADVQSGATAPATLALSRATIIMGSKDTRAERADESTPLRIASERVKNVLYRILHASAASNSGLAAAFVTAMATIHLPDAFNAFVTTAMHAVVELEAGYAYGQGTAAEARAVEVSRIRRTGRIFLDLNSVLDRFNSDGLAWTEVERLSVAVLSASHSSASTLVRLAALNALLRTAAWQSFVSHAVTSDPMISGADLVSAMITSHNDLSSASAGMAAGSGAGGAGPDNAVSTGGAGHAYGSVRESSLADALLADEAREALETAATQTGIERVETLMQSGSTVCMRSTFLQEAWLQNKATALSFASMDEPYLRPYFASVLCEDSSTGTVHDRLSGYVFPETALTTLRTTRWSGVPILKMALDIESLKHGCSFRPVSELDAFTVGHCLNLMRDTGSRLFFALGLDLSPQDGMSFTDGVDLQIESCNFARTLPAKECAEWLKFSAHEFKSNFLDGGGEHYHSKLRSSRPDHDQAVISEFCPPTNAFFVNVKARRRRAEPIAELRVALPSLLGAAPITVPGTSGGATDPGDDVEDTRSKKGKKKKKDKDERNQNKEVGPGSKSGMAYEISPTELFHTGVVFKSKEITDKYGLDPDACLPVLLTKKSGDAALQLCPEHGTHGGMNAKCHKRPKGFDLNFIYKNFTRKAKPEELKVANWSPRKKSKA